MRWRMAGDHSEREWNWRSCTLVCVCVCAAWWLARITLFFSFLLTFHSFPLWCPLRSRIFFSGFFYLRWNWWAVSWPQPPEAHPLAASSATGRHPTTAAAVAIKFQRDETSAARCALYLSLNLVCQLIIKSPNIPFDSPWTALSEFFWDQLDQITWSVPKVGSKCADI